MKRILKYMAAFVLCFSLTNCDDYLNTTSPENTDDDFVTSTVSETAKTLSWAYANYRQNCLMGTYAWNDPISSDVEHYPEQNSANNINARLKPESLAIDAVSGGFNNLYSTISRTSKIATLIAEKNDYKSAVEAHVANDWTQLYGEAMTLRALCYFDLVRHFGDVPYGYENSYVNEYALTSRFEIFDVLIASLKEVEKLMYDIGDSKGITAEKMSRTFANALIGQIALWAGGYQTIRTDIPDLYGDVQFTTKGDEKYGCKYARRSDYQSYYTIAEQYFDAALNAQKGSVRLITTDERSYANNPFQRHFQYLHDLEVSPESLFEGGILQGTTPAGSQTNEFGYAFGRPSGGGSANAAPPKVFAAVRIVPTFYYGSWENGDKRRDASITVTASDGKGREVLLDPTPGNMLKGGISINKWDMNRMNPPYTTSQRQSGINWGIMRLADVILMQAEVKAELGKSAEAISLLNQIRERAFGDTSHNISGLTGDELKAAILLERKYELLGEGQVRWDLIRSGTYSESAMAVRAEMNAMFRGLETDGYYTFSNGNTISQYIWVKNVQKSQPLTYDSDVNDPALYPGWRGVYDYSSTPAASVVVTTDNNLAIKGLFNYINPAGPEAAALEADNYIRTAWGATFLANKDTYLENILSGIESATTPPRYYWPIPGETITMSKGLITNGYGMPQP